MLRRNRKPGVILQGVKARSAPTHSLIATMKGPCDPQSSSPLFSTIPPEIRNRIFSLALYSYDNTSHPYPDGTYYTRPGYRYQQCISIALLETCKRIYTETHDLPISQNEHVFWCSRGPPRHLFRDNSYVYFDRFTVEQKMAVLRIHLFTQLYWLQGPTFKDICLLKDINPRHLKITVRHTDWWHWEENTPLVMNTKWMYNIRLFQKLDTFDVELETMERDKDQMETIVEDMYQLRLPLAKSRILSSRGNRITKERYMGTSAFDNQIYYSSNDNRWKWGKPPQNPPEQMPYVVSTIRWTAEALGEINTKDP